MDRRTRVSEPTTPAVCAGKEEVLTVKEMARYLRCHVSTLYRLVDRGDIPHFRLGSDIRFRRSLIEKWLDKQSCSR
jgi:excisionase family DNA binding protein